MGRCCYFSCDTTPQGPDILAAMVASARRCGVTDDFHVFSHRHVPDAIVYKPGPIDVKFHTFKWRLLRDELAHMDYDYFVWLDSDNVFVRNPGDLEKSLLRDNRMWCLMESDMTSPKMRIGDWWGIKTPNLLKLFRDNGAGERVWNSNGGMWAVRREHVAEFVETMESFRQKCYAMGYKNVHDELPLAWIGQTPDWVKDPERNTNAAAAAIWACDWQGVFSDRIPTGKPWAIEDYMTGERRIANPAIVHAMRSKMAMARGLDHKPEDNAIPPAVAEWLGKAALSGKYQIAVWREEFGKIYLDHLTNNWQKSDFDESLKMLAREVAIKKGDIPAEAAPIAKPYDGAGTILAGMFAAMGFKAEAEQPETVESAEMIAENIRIMECGGCKAMLARMDNEGPEWCESHVDEIVMRIKANAANRPVAVFGSLDRIPFFETTARYFVNQAIKKAKRVRDEYKTTSGS